MAFNKLVYTFFYQWQIKEIHIYIHTFIFASKNCGAKPLFKIVSKVFEMIYFK